MPCAPSTTRARWRPVLWRGAARRTSGPNRSAVCCGQPLPTRSATRTTSGCCAPSWKRAYFDPEGGHDVAMEELHMSRTTYFRRLRAAVDRVARRVLDSRA